MTCADNCLETIHEVRPSDYLNYDWFHDMHCAKWTNSCTGVPTTV